MNKIFIVTGANGHLGNTIVKKLVGDNQTVRALVLKNDKVEALKGVHCKIYYGDVKDSSSLDEIFSNLDNCEVVVIHCAGIVSIASKFVQNVYDVNVNGTRNIVEKCKQFKVSKLVHVSSVHAIPERKKGDVITEVSHFDKNKVHGLYAKTKAEASQIVLDAAAEGLNASIVHPSGIMGANDFGRGHITQVVIDYFNGTLTACVRGGYDFVDVMDVASGTIAACEKGKAGECYILCNRHYEMLDILNILSKLTGKRPITTILPKWFASFVAPVAELYYKLKRQPPLYTKYSLYTLETNSCFNSGKAQRELGFKNRPVEDSLKDTILFLKENNRIKENINIL